MLQPHFVLKRCSSKTNFCILMLANLLFNKNWIIDNFLFSPTYHEVLWRRKIKTKTCCYNAIIMGPFVFSQTAINLGHSKRMQNQSWNENIIFFAREFSCVYNVPLIHLKLRNESIYSLATYKFLERHYKLLV